MINLIGVDSSMIAAAGYDPESRVLVVLFNNGRAYEYHDVPEDKYTGLLEAESKGRYMNENIIDVYPYRHFRGWDRS